MTRIYNDPADFKEEVIAGFEAAYSRYVRRVEGASGFVRQDGPSAGKVSLVVGGGSGHYPSYSGVTGRGFADGAVLGDVFTSPSAEQVYRIARAADGGAGVVLSFGNYAGDRLNFAAAQERLVAEGIDTRIVYVTDDIASAKPAEVGNRRGIAGTFTVYKIGGAAAELGEDLDAVERVMRKANAATFSYGVAFQGCTFPGQQEPLFHVDEGRMEFGLGIHGEPGVSSAATMPARDLAKALVDALLEERPEGADGRAAVLMNGLGATKYEELFLLYGCVCTLLAEAGVEVVLPEVGELVTSLDMAGCSLSLTWLDDELERLWTAPADTASFRRGDLSALPVHERARTSDSRSAADAHVAAAGEGSKAAATLARAALATMRDVVLANEGELGRIDAVAGDGDHGVGMARGSRAACAAAEAVPGDAGVGTVLAAAADAFSDRAGGTSGILWGIFLSAIGASLGDQDDVTGERVGAALRHGADTMQRIGKAERGDKTMLDALLPFADELESRLAKGEPLGSAWDAAAAVAVSAAGDTAQLRPRVGRARPLAERSIGTPDAGATSMGLILDAVASVVRDASSKSEETR
jgi:dihydroxyacetone kinase